MENRNDRMNAWDNDRLRETIEVLKQENEEQQAKLKQLFDAYIHTRLEYSGSWGNLRQDRRREVIVHEIEAELGWKV